MSGYQGYQGYETIRLRTAEEEEEWQAHDTLVLESPTDSEDEQLVVERVVQREVAALRERASKMPPVNFKPFAGKAYSIVDAVEGTSLGYRATREEY